MKSYLKTVVVLSWMVLPLFVSAQTERELLAQLLEEEQSSVEALALYPESTRVAILEAARYPEALIKLESLQGKTSVAFKSLLEPYPKELQEKVWDLTRYTGIVATIVEGGQKWGIDLDVALQDYPPEIMQRARELSYDYFPLLTEVHRLNRQWDGAFRELVATYPPPTRDAIQQLVELPEVLSLLTDNIRLTVLVGDLYQRNPAWLLRQMDSLNLVVAEARTKELDAWKKNLENDPEARAELEKAAKDYVSDDGYDDEFYNYDDAYYDRETIVEYHYYHYNYPYWFGYPSWYAYPRWRPYPYWYDWGFYYGPGNSIVIIDLPSYWFVNWYFYYPWHHYYYPHLSSHYANHYYGHRTSSSSITTNVRTWKNRNRDVVTDDWLNRARTDANAFREFGKFETEREKYNNSHPDKPVTQGQFLDKNSRKYPDLTQAVDRKKELDRVEDQRRAPTTVEPKRPNDTTAPTRKPEVSPKPVEPRKPDISPKPPKVEPRKQPPVNLPKVEKAQKHHQDAWEQTKREAPKRPSIQQPRTPPANLKVPKTAPAPKIKTAPSAPRKKGGGE
ncbi:MAG: hypothetical protein K9J37_02525 [Saprospiraceae bacterium]|nr:hypothetical protein [Saprospiraceae bacterium]MCF8248755.1 hypothetical protein [Saprospiraceae bacterium]MCF8278755.1 hypothetical protein [Bacteroidales bacterium]MCF8310555.1 hypothetical protein [Saprospiraceae bacterium]MCF8439114.1 hypothetical protein [Saprospiraceae bacterium]